MAVPVDMECPLHKCLKTTSVIKTSTIFVTSTPKNIIAATLYDSLTGPDFPEFWVIELTLKVNR